MGFHHTAGVLAASRTHGRPCMPTSMFVKCLPLGDAHTSKDADSLVAGDSPELC